jgi:hypothetical protein
LEDTIRVLNFTAKKGQAFVIAADQYKQYYKKWTLKLPGNFFKTPEVNVSLTFAVDRWLLPCLVNVTTEDGVPIEVIYEYLDWFPSDLDREQYAVRVKHMLEFHKVRAQREAARYELTSLLTKLQRFADMNTAIDDERRSVLEKTVKENQAWLATLKKTPAPVPEYESRTAAVHDATDSIVEAFLDTPSVFITKIAKALEQAEDLLQEARDLPLMDTAVRDDATEFFGTTFAWFNEYSEKAEVAELKAKRAEIRKKLQQLKQGIIAGKSREQDRDNTDLL